MTTRRENSTQDDARLRIVGHRLQETGGGATRNDDIRPRRPSSTPSTQAAQHRPGQRVSQLRQIVLVDRDIDALREVAIALREQFDFHVTISGNEALTLLQRGTIDAIVVGQTLYSSTGLNVLAEARRRAPHTQRVLLANTTEATASDSEAAPARPFRILERPCTPQGLLELLETQDEIEASPAAPASPRVVPPQPTVARSAGPVYHGDYEHVILETPPPLRRKASRNSVFSETLPIVVYTDDGEFYQAICAALQDQHDIRLATQLERAVEMSEIGACPILITDRAGTQSELQRISIALRAAEPALVTIASGTPNEGLALRKLLNTPALHSFLPKPLSASLLRLAVESAKRHYISLKVPDAELREPTVAPDPPTARAGFIARPRDYRPLQAFEPSLEIEDRFDLRRWLPYAGVALLAALIIAGGVWYWESRSNADSQVAILIDAELELAQRAYDARDYVAPENANALYFYRRVLSRDPNQPQALQGIDRIVERIVEQAERQLTDDMLDAASKSVALLRQLRPDHKRIEFLEGQIRKGTSYRQAQRAAQQSAEMARAEAVKTNAANARLLESRAAEPLPSPALISNATQRTQAVTRWLAAAQQRIAQGRLIAPETDSAEYYLRLVERADPSNPAVDRGLREISARLIADAENALSNQQLDRARRRLADVGRFGPDAAVVAGLQRRIDAATDANVRSNFLRLALQRTRENALFEPAQDSAKYYLSQLQRLDARGAEVQQAIRAMALKLVENANQATAQQQFNVAVRLLDEVRRLGFDGPELTEADNRLQQARAPTKPPPPPVEKPPLVLPKIIKSVPPKFPDDARTAGVSGWVDVGFKISATGDVYDAVAMASSPPGPYAAKFERAAVAAIGQYKFESRNISDAQTQTMVVRVQFKVQ